MGDAKFESGISDALTVKSTNSAVNVLFQTSAGQSGELSAHSNGMQFNAPLPGNNIYFYTQGANPVVFKSGGNVGIGTTSPSTKLHVAGDVTVDGNIAGAHLVINTASPFNTAVGGQALAANTNRVRQHG